MESYLDSLRSWVSSQLRASKIPRPMSKGKSEQRQSWTVQSKSSGCYKTAPRDWDYDSSPCWGLVHFHGKCPKKREMLFLHFYAILCHDFLHDIFLLYYRTAFYDMLYYDISWEFLGTLYFLWDFCQWHLNHHCGLASFQSWCLREWVKGSEKSNELCTPIALMVRRMLRLWVQSPLWANLFQMPVSKWKFG